MPCREQPGMALGWGQCNTTLIASASWNFAPRVPLFPYPSLALGMTSLYRKANNLRLNNKHSCSLNFQSIHPREDIDHLLHRGWATSLSAPLSGTHFLLSFRKLSLFPTPLLLFPFSSSGPCPQGLHPSFMRGHKDFWLKEDLVLPKRSSAASYICRLSIYGEMVDQSIWTMSLKMIKFWSLLTLLLRGPSHWEVM